MKKLIKAVVVALALFEAVVFGTKANAADRYVGKLDLNWGSPAAVLARNYTDGIWMAGVEVQAFQLQDASQGDKEIAYLAPQYLHGIQGNNQTLGLAIGVPVGNDVINAINGVMGFMSKNAPMITLPPVAQEISNVLTIEVGGGYNFARQFGYLKPWLATVGAEVRYPIGSGAKL
ncbi:MAG: hypothetical protein KGL39_32540 [Patescibacteria group bacterium]|nr:hypothetical protein [Patescibacteria group bacterium]